MRRRECRRLNIPIIRSRRLCHNTRPMRIGVPTEIKTDEYRVGMTPAGAAVLAGDGHEVFVQSGAGNGSSFSEEEYKTAGAKILPDADAVYDKAEMIVKVKEPSEPDLN